MYSVYALQVNVFISCRYKEMLKKAFILKITKLYLVKYEFYIENKRESLVCFKERTLLQLQFTNYNSSMLLIKV